MVAQKSSARLDWEDARVLVELARHGSLSSAARALGVTHVTVSRRIANLEADLRQTLFTREGGRFVVTEAGRRVLAHAGAMASAADAIVRTANATGNTLTGPVRVTATEAVGVHIMMPALRVVRETYPDLDIEVCISQLNLNLSRSETDIAVRLAEPPDDPSLYAERVATLEYGLFGARSYVNQRNPELYEFIGYPRELSHWPEATTLAHLAGGARIAMRTNHLSNRIEAARLGLGIALMPVIMAQPWPELVNVSRGPPPMIRNVTVLTHADMREVPRIRAAMDIMIEEIATRIGLAREARGHPVSDTPVTPNRPVDSVAPTRHQAQVAQEPTGQSGAQG